MYGPLIRRIEREDSRASDLHNIGLEATSWHDLLSRSLLRKHGLSGSLRPRPGLIGRTDTQGKGHPEARVQLRPTHHASDQELRDGCKSTVIK